MINEGIGDCLLAGQLVSEDIKMLLDVNVTLYVPYFCRTRVSEAMRSPSSVSVALTSPHFFASKLPSSLVSKNYTKCTQ